ERVWATVHEMGHAFGLPHSGEHPQSPANTPPGGIMDANHHIGTYDEERAEIKPADANAILRNAFERPVNPHNVHVHFSGPFTRGTWFTRVNELDNALSKALTPPPLPTLLPATGPSAPVTGTSPKP